jgi:hypothetical protein
MNRFAWVLGVAFLALGTWAVAARADILVVLQAIPCTTGLVLNQTVACNAVTLPLLGM